ncbi:MAG: ADP-ribosylglycohydrolase family protein [Elusimicrobia bacterium]|nr:ADP-ribosylglycohydrolase family protein [Elusimicrobiota bacterium]
MGGDTDTTGAIFGALCGAATGAQGIPAEWLRGICDYPRSIGWVRELARRLHAAAVKKDMTAPLPLAWPWVPARNAFFLAVVLGHGLRRLLPPYS